MVKATIRLCPQCCLPLKWWQISAAGVFPCPHCGTQLQAPASYARWLGLGNLLVSLVLFAALGFRGFHLFYTIALAWVPVQFLALNLVKGAIPPQIGFAIPEKSYRQLVKEIMGPTELNLRGKKCP
jgi:hypothetical protein